MMEGDTDKWRRVLIQGASFMGLVLINQVCAVRLELLLICC